MSQKLIQIGIIYFVVGILLGFYMAASHDHVLAGAHAHINLLGWGSIILMGLVYRAYPQIEKLKSAKVFFYSYNLALPVMMVSLALYLKGNAEAEVGIAVSSVFVVVGALSFALSVFRGLRAPVTKVN